MSPKACGLISLLSIACGTVVADRIARLCRSCLWIIMKKSSALYLLTSCWCLKCHKAGSRCVASWTCQCLTSHSQTPMTQPVSSYLFVCLIATLSNLECLVPVSACLQHSRTVQHMVHVEVWHVHDGLRCKYDIHMLYISDRLLVYPSLHGA